LAYVLPSITNDAWAALVRPEYISGLRKYQRLKKLSLRQLYTGLFGLVKQRFNSFLDVLFLGWIKTACVGRGAYIAEKATVKQQERRYAIN
jgi:hypothetical protein